MAGLLVVDDIPVIRSTIARIVTNQKPDLQPVIQASSGEEAVNLARLHQPDIILMDIKMPKLDGLQAVSIIRHEHPAAKIIMLTAYDEFTYAQQALRLGAVDYLLKPIRPTKLMAALTQVEDQILKEQRQHQEIETVKAQLQQTSCLVEANLLENLIRDAPVQDTAEIEAMLTALGKTITMPVAMVFAINPVDTLSLRPIRASEELRLKQQLTRTLQQALPNPNRALISCRWSAREVVALISTDPERATPDQLRALAETLRRLVEAVTSTNVYVGMGFPYPHLDAVARSCAEARLALCLSPVGGRVIHIADLQEVVMQDLPGYLARQHLNHLLASVRQNQYQTGVKYLQALCDEMEMAYPAARSQQLIITSYTRLMVLVAYAALEAGAPHTSALKLVRQQQATLPTISHPTSWLLHLLTEIMTIIESTNQQRKPVQSAVEYIHRNLHRADISLADVAKAVNLSPSHLAHLLKTQLGMSYVKYLTLVRIEQAKKLLCATDFNINAIAEMVGYRNMTHFYRLFQRETNLTPAAYRRTAPSL